MDPGDDAAAYGHQQEGDPQPPDILQVDGADARHDHDVEEEAGDAVEQVVVLILPSNEPGFAPLLQQHPQQHGQGGADDEVEAPDQGVQRPGKARRHRRQTGGHAPGGQEGAQVHQHHHGDLDGQLVDGVGDGDLVGAVEEIRVVLGILGGAGAADLAPAGEHVQDDDAHDAGHQIARRGDGQTEAAPAGKAQGLIAGADVVGLAGALAVAHGQQQAAGFEQAGHYGVGQQQGDHKADDPLGHIRADDDGAGLEPGQVPALLAGLRGHAQTHGDEAQRDAVVHQDLHQADVHPDKTHVAGDQQQETAQHRHGHQAFADEGQILAQKVRQKDGACDQPQLDDDVP